MTYYVQRPVAGVGDHGALIEDDEIDAKYAASLVAGGFLEELQGDDEVPADAFVPEVQIEPMRLPAPDAPMSEWQALGKGLLHNPPRKKADLIAAVTAAVRGEVPPEPDTDSE